MVLVADPDAQLEEAVGALEQGEVADLAIGIGAGLDPRLEQMLARDEEDPPVGEQDGAGRRDEGGTDALALDQLVGEPGASAGAACSTSRIRIARGWRAGGGGASGRWRQGPSSPSLRGALRRRLRRRSGKLPLRGSDAAIQSGACLGRSTGLLRSARNDGRGRSGTAQPRPITRATWRVSVYCWKVLALPSATRQTWTICALSSLPVALQVPR